MSTSASSSTGSILRPFNAATDAHLVSNLLRTSTVSRIQPSDALFLSHPGTVSLIVATCSLLLYRLQALFFSTLTVRAEVIASDDDWRWQDNAALVIYALPPLALVLAAYFGLAHVYHSQLWNTVAERTERRIDVVDPSAYYSDAHLSSSGGTAAARSGSAFWCLEFGSDVVACVAVDGRNPGRQTRTLARGDVPLPSQRKETTADEDDEEEDERDLELFRQSGALAASSQPTEFTPTLPPEVIASAPSADIAFRTLSETDLQSACHIRHLAIAPSFRQSTEVDAYILDLAVHAALGSSAAVATRFDSVLLMLDPKLDKALRAAALNRGFCIIDSVPLRKWQAAGDGEVEVEGNRVGGKSWLWAALAAIWPLSFRMEVLRLQRSEWEKQKQRL